VKVFNILGLGGEISQLLGKLYFSLVELFECDFKAFHESYGRLKMLKKVKVTKNIILYYEKNRPLPNFD
jgi:hypothetical protein